jgi:hypothetical protein
LNLVVQVDRGYDKVNQATLSRSSKSVAALSGNLVHKGIVIPFFKKIIKLKNENESDVANYLLHKHAKNYVQILVFRTTQNEKFVDLSM